MDKFSPYSDEDVLTAVREKGATGWELFCAQFDPLIHSVVGWPKWKFSEHEKQDVFQNIYVQLPNALVSFREESSLSWFIKQIAIHHCVNEIRRQVRWRHIMTSTVQKTPDGDWNEMEFNNPNALDPHHEVLQKERRQALRVALTHLKDTCKKSISLFYVQDLSYREMSEQLGISTNTVGSRLAKCLDKLHKELRHHPLFERSCL